MKKILILTLISFLLISYKSSSQEIKVQSLSKYRGNNDIFVENFRCGLFVPPNYTPTHKYPVIIFLHGYSDTTSWPLPWYRDPILSKDPCIVITPKCPITENERWGDSWRNGLSPSLGKAFAVFDQVGRDFSVDTSRYYIYGSSMGGYGTFAAIKNFPSRFAAAYVECANGNLQIAPIVAKIPFWMFHGSKDDRVPVKGSRDMYKAVMDAGGKQIRYTEYEGVGHNVWDYTGKETTLLPWLLSQKKGISHSKPNINLIPTKTKNSDNSIKIEWSLPKPDDTNLESHVWYVKVYKNDSVIKEVYNDSNSYIDASFKPRDKYKVSAVNYYFLESEIRNLKE